MQETDGFVPISYRELTILGRFFNKPCARCSFITDMPHKTPKVRSLTGVVSPTPLEIKKARLKAGFSKREAALSVFVSTATWVSWEKPLDSPSNKPMHPAFALLFSYQSGLTLPPNAKYIDESKAPV